MEWDRELAAAVTEGEEVKAAELASGALDSRGDLMVAIPAFPAFL